MTTWDNIVSEIDVHTFQLSRRLEVGQTYTASLLGDNLGPVVVQLGEEVAVGALDENNSLTFTLQEPVESTEISFLLGQNSGEVIRAKLEKGHKATDWTEAPEDVDAQFSEIRQTAEEISLSVEDQGKDLRSEIKLTSEEITSMVEDKERGLNTKISQTAGEITREFEDELSGAVASIEESARGITSRVGKVERDIGDTSGLRYSISTEIRQTKDSITQEILDSQNNAVSRINLSKDGAKIYGEKIDLQGLVAIWNKDGTSSTQINGDKIATGTIHGNKITANSLHGDKITAGTIRANRIMAEMLRGNTIRTSTDGGGKYAHLKHHELTFITNNVDKMQIGFQNRAEPYIRMGSGSGGGNGILKIEKNYDNAHIEYPTSSGDSRLRMRDTGNVDLRAGSTLYIGGGSGTSVTGSLAIAGSTSFAGSVSMSQGLTVPEDKKIRFGKNQRGSLYYYHNYGYLLANSGYKFLDHSSPANRIDVEAANFNTSSSIKGKSNIRDVEGSSLDVIRDLDILSYHFNRDLENRTYDNKQIGVISEVSPEVASYDGESVSLYSFASHTARAVQELDPIVHKNQEEITTLYEVIDVMIGKSKALEEKVVKLEEELDSAKRTAD